MQIWGGFACSANSLSVQIKSGTFFSEEHSRSQFLQMQGFKNALLVCGPVWKALRGTPDTEGHPMQGTQLYLLAFMGIQHDVWLAKK